MDAITIIGVIALHLSLALVATLLVVRDNLLERSQRRYQLITAWLVPCVGSLLIIVIAGGRRFTSRQRAVAVDPTTDAPSEIDPYLAVHLSRQGQHSPSDNDT